MAITNEEMQTIAHGLERSGAREMIIAATAVHLARSLYADSKLPLQMAVLEEMAAAWLREGGRDPVEFAAAAAAVKRADETFQLLQSVPS